MYYFIANRCADNLEVEQQFAPVDDSSDSSDSLLELCALMPCIPTPVPVTGCRSLISYLEQDNRQRQRH